MSVVRKSAVILAAIIALIITLTVYFMCLGFIRATQYYSWNHYIQHPRVLLSDAHDQLKAGDILLFVGSAHNLMTSMLTQVLYSHAAMVVSHNGMLYVSESTVAEPYMIDPILKRRRHTQNGTNVIPLLDRLSNYCGQVFVMPLNKRLDPATEANIWRAASAFYPYPSTAQAFMGLAGIHTRSRHCFQHTGHLIDIMGLRPKTGKKPFSDMGIIEVVTEIVDLPGKDLKRGYRYLPVYNIQFDITNASPPRIGGFEQSWQKDISARSETVWKQRTDPAYRIDVRSRIELFDERHRRERSGVSIIERDERIVGHETSVANEGNSSPRSQQNGEGQDGISRYLVEDGTASPEAEGNSRSEELLATGDESNPEDGSGRSGDTRSPKGPILADGENPESRQTRQ